MQAAEILATAAQYVACSTAGLQRVSEPRFPEWPMGVSDEEISDEVDGANAWILETNCKLSWEEVYQGGEQASCAS